jgi:hypothetical protein
MIQVTATDEMCQLLQFKYPMTPYYDCDEDKIFTTFKFTVTSKQRDLREKLRRDQSYNFGGQNVLPEHYISVTYISFVTSSAS